ncbi:MAG: oligosaccharide flippase family protein [Roseburia sp.]|nr:oligosaccharide flippase family protein [Roseburia sp.]MCM1202066.1 oligosaccharide flippase family protein [Bacteroides fragilis]
MNQQIKKGALISYLTIIFNILSVLLYTPFLIRSLGSSEYAIYTLVYSFISYFTIDFGIGSSVARFITDFRYRVDAEYTEKQLLTVVFKVFFLLAIVLGLVFSVIYPFLGNFFSGLTPDEIIQMRKAYSVAAFYTVFAFAATPFEGIFTANEYFVAFKLYHLLQKILTVIFTLIVLVMNWGLLMVMWAGTAGGMIIIVLEGLYLLRKKAIEIEWSYWNFSLLKKIISFSIWMAVVSFAQRFIIPITPTILGRFSDSSEIAVFSVASTLEGYIFTFGAVVSGLFLPEVSRLINGNNRERLNRLFVKIGRIQLIIIGAILTAAADFGKEFIILWAGEEYRKSYYILLIISMSNVVYVTQQIASTVLIVMNEVRYRAMVYICGAAVSVLGSCMLAPRYGAVGAACGIAVCLWGFNVLAMTIVYQKVARLDIKGFFRKCHMAMLPYFISYGAVWFFLNRYLPGGKWEYLVIKGSFWGAGFMILLFGKILNAEEKNAVTKFLKRK